MADADRVGLAYTVEKKVDPGDTFEWVGGLLTRVSGSYITEGYLVGDRIEIEGFINDTSNGIFVISIVANLALTVTVSPPNEVAGPDVIISRFVYGVLPPFPILTDMRFVSESLSQTSSIIQSAQIRPDRQVDNIRRVNASVLGDIGIEFSDRSFDDFIEAVLMSDKTWGARVTASGGVTHTFEDSDNSVNRPSGSYITDGFTIGKWLYAPSANPNLNNSFYKILSVAALKIVFETIVVDEAVTTNGLIQPSQVIDGGLLRSFSFERDYNDLTNIFAVYTGIALESFSINAAPDAIITGSFGLMGQSAASGTATIGDGSNISVLETEIFTAVDNIIHIKENAAIFSATGFSLTLNNNLRNRLQIGSLGPVSLGLGKVNASGVLQAYFTTQAIMDKYLNMTETSLAIAIGETVGGTPPWQNGYIIFFPRVKFTNGKRIASGENTDILADMSWSAISTNIEKDTVVVFKMNSV